MYKADKMITSIIHVVPPRFLLLLCFMVRTVKVYQGTDGQGAWRVTQHCACMLQ